MNKYGALIEDLIYLKDKHREDLSFSEIDTINKACNALEHEGTESGKEVGSGE